MTIKNLDFIRDNAIYPVRVNNGVFTDLRELDVEDAVKPFLYSYYSLITLLYRNCLFSKGAFTQNKMKEVLGYSPINKTLDRLIKNDGVLDKMGYTRSSNVFPVTWGSLHGEQIMHSYSMNHELGRNFKVKVPLRALYKDHFSHRTGALNGSYYQFNDTHSVDVDLFYRCFSNDNIGATGYYMCNFIKVCIGNKRYHGSVKEIVNGLSISKDTTHRYLKLIMDNNLIPFEDNGRLLEISLYMRGFLSGWRKKIFEHYNHKCYISGKTENLDAHHIKPFTEIRDMALDFTQLPIKKLKDYSKEELHYIKDTFLHLHASVEGVILNNDVHTEFHRYYGDNKIGIAEIQEFKRRYEIGEIEI